MPNTAKIKEYVLGNHRFRVEKGIPLPEEPVELEEVDLLPIDKLKQPKDSLATDYEYNVKNRDRVKSKVSYLMKKSARKEEFQKMKFSVRKDPKNNKTIRVYRLN
jgi:hypothetical protein